ncbi:MAG: hypothetical protein H6839_15580 [Planctomycetes bacterium]|nr:hypothetical protein [Planctomycetota bacterium]
MSSTVGVFVAEPHARTDVFEMLRSLLGEPEREGTNETGGFIGWDALGLDIALVWPHGLESDGECDFENYSFCFSFKRWAGSLNEERDSIARELAMILGRAVHGHFGARVMVVDNVQVVLARWPAQDQSSV